VARSRTLALPVDPDVAVSPPLDASPRWRAEDERLALAERALARLIELEALIRAQRNVIEEASVDQRDHAAVVLRELQERADAEMLRLNALRFPTTSVQSSASTRSLTRAHESRWTTRLPERATFILGMYAAADIAPRTPSARRRLRRRRLRSSR
jgi:hypothetical protein